MLASAHFGLCCESIGSMMLPGVFCLMCAVCAMLCIVVEILLLSRVEYRWTSSGFITQVFLCRLRKSGDLKTRFWGEPLEKFLRTMPFRNIHRAAVGQMAFLLFWRSAIWAKGRA